MKTRSDPLYFMNLAYPQQKPFYQDHYCFYVMFITRTDFEKVKLALIFQETGKYQFLKLVDIVVAVLITETVGHG